MGRGGRAGGRAGARVSTLERRLLDLQLNQLLRRRTLLEKRHDRREVAEVCRMVREIFGDQGVVETQFMMGRRVGPLECGYFIDPPPPPDAKKHPTAQGPIRRTKILFRGESAIDIAEQIRMWKFRRGE